MTTLIIAEHNNQTLNPATLHAVTAAAKLGDVHILVAGHQAEAVANQAKTVAHVSKVLSSDAPHFAHAQAEEIAPLIVSMAKNYRHIAASATAFGKNLMPRVAALLDVSQISDLSEVVDETTFVRAIYAGNAFETVSCQDEHIVLTIRATAFEAAQATGSDAVIEIVVPTAAQNLSQFIREELMQSERPELTQAKVVVAGGRALQSEEHFNQIIHPLADALGAAIGASRAAVDAGFVPNDSQVGQTGKVVAPQLYIAVGISGAIQHVAGMQDSKVIVAINKDPDAAIFKVADFGLVADLNTAVPELINALKAL
ncbi:electron transfer flavoprotein subunit alpha/FixB family protein [Neisseria sp. Ec49-e6-T10]|uniref:electron transfer flavoprotein subunit alpha/FixB family protein n=1 Tax=Neisseria sp. Ec49-e6-T10 TaxID=3140744 RepID=UPI003EC10393